MSDEPREVFEVEVSPTPENIAALEGECDDLRAALAQARAEAAVMIEVLDALALISPWSSGVCPVCGLLVHAENCGLRRATGCKLAERGRLMLAVVIEAKALIEDVGDNYDVLGSDSLCRLGRAVAAYCKHKERTNGEEESETQVCSAQADEGVGGG